LLAEALRLAEQGDWEGAHGIVQRDEVDPLSCWIHAVLHRQEGDLSNARYWYPRSGRELREDIAPRAELAEIRAALPPGGELRDSAAGKPGSRA
jgi:hypothetical protein